MFSGGSSHVKLICPTENDTDGFLGAAGGAGSVESKTAPLEYSLHKHSHISTG